MKILLINGSPRKTSTTFRVVQQIANVMREGDFPVEFDEVHLCEMNLRMCRGCYQCLSGDESMCPLQDDRALLEKKMTEADAVIFSSPVYVANVSALFKNFVDRFAYCCHRPRFHGKSAMVVSSAGSDGAGIVNILMTMMIETWGFDVVKRLGVNLDPNLSVEAKTRQWKINELKAHKAALAMVGSPPGNPSISTRQSIQRNSFSLGFSQEYHEDRDKVMSPPQPHEATLQSLLSELHHSYQIPVTNGNRDIPRRYPLPSDRTLRHRARRMERWFSRRNCDFEGSSRQVARRLRTSSGIR